MRAATLRRLERKVDELVARHDGGAGELERLQVWRDDPLGFADAHGIRLWSKQREIVRSVLENPLTCVPGGVGTGKDYTGAFLSVWWTCCRGGLVVQTSTTSRQAYEIMLAETGRLWASCNLPGELYRTSLRVPGAGGVLAFTSNEVSRLTGHHHPSGVLVVLSEAQGLDPAAVEAALSCASDDGDRVLMVGNPLEPDTRFHRAALAAHWNTVTVPVTSHPNITGDEEPIPGGPSERWIRDLESEYGPESPIVRARVHAEFPSESVESLFRREWLEAADARYRSRRNIAAEVRTLEPVIGVDVARFGPDRTVLAVRRGPFVLGFESWGGLDLMTSCHRIAAVASRYGVEPEDDLGPAIGMLVVDEIGVGGGAADRLVALGFDVSAFNAARRSSQPSMYRNRRTAAYWELRKRFEDGRIVMAKDERVFSELLAHSWSVVPGTGAVAIEPKDTVISKLGRSPDYADALALAFAPSMRITVGEWLI